MSKRRVVVTGLGAVSPLGPDMPSAWDNALAGRSGVAPLEVDFDLEPFPTRFGAQVKGFDVTRSLSSKDARRMDVFIHYGIVAAQEAMRDAGLEVTDDDAHRVGVSIGSGIGGIHGIERTYKQYLDNGPRKISPFFVPSCIINMISGDLSIMHGLKGPNLATVTACTTGTHNIGLAARLIQYGDADAMVAGGSEMCTTASSLGGFCSARALSTRNDDPERASRPWDRDRDGFVLGDGAAVLVLEEYERARRRGAPIYAEILGFGMSGDAYHMTQPAEGGDGACRCMQGALDDARIDAGEVDYINAHGTSTKVGDVAECTAIKTTFGAHARKLAVSSTKSMTGHMLGAAGSMEAAFSVLSLRDQVIPPTVNLDNPDEGCDLDFVPHTARETGLDVVLSNSFGFGGTNGTLVFRRLA
ncbi:MAG TPA: beta-ketoacyl-ACP synthase II [Gammaproteobacteria bacterium]|nr:beta-ketoacyl-ACP synthase II [Gammaproteobacteria bacterium]